MAAVTSFVVSVIMFTDFAVLSSGEILFCIVVMVYFSRQLYSVGSRMVMTQSFR